MRKPRAAKQNGGILNWAHVYASKGKARLGLSASSIRLREIMTR